MSTLLPLSLPNPHDSVVLRVVYNLRETFMNKMQKHLSLSLNICTHRETPSVIMNGEVFSNRGNQCLGLKINHTGLYVTTDLHLG